MARSAEPPLFTHVCGRVHIVLDVRTCGSPYLPPQFNPAMQLDVESDGSIRRSKRVKVQPVAYWKNEKVVYKPSQEKSIETVGKTGDTETEKDFVFVSSIVGTMQPDEPIKPKRAGGRKKGTWRGGMAVTKFDSSRLDHNLKYLNDDKVSHTRAHTRPTRGPYV